MEQNRVLKQDVMKGLIILASRLVGNGGVYNCKDNRLFFDLMRLFFSDYRVVWTGI